MSSMKKDKIEIGRENSMKKRLERKRMWGGVAFIGLNLIMGLIVGFVGVIVVMRQGRLDSDDGDLGFVIWLFGFFVMLALSSYLQIVIHEFGHFIFGKLSGYSLSSFRIGKIAFVKKGEKVVVQKLNVPGTGGQCLMSPPEINPYNIPYFLYNMGGAFANLIVSVVCLILYFFCYKVPYLSELLVILSITGVFTALTNGIPLENKLVKNDGGNVVELVKHVNARRDFWLQLTINHQYMNGVRYKDMPREWFLVTGNVEDQSALSYTMWIYSMMRDFDNLEIEKVKEAIEVLLEKGVKMVGMHRNELLCEQLFCEMLLNDDVEEVKKLYTKELKRYAAMTGTNMGRQRLLYGYHSLIEKDEKKAEKALKTFEKQSQKNPIQAEVEMEKEWMELLTKRIAKKQEPEVLEEER